MVHRIQMKVSSTKSEMKKILYLSKQDDNKRKMNESGFGSLRLNTIFHFVIFVKKLYLIATNMNRFAVVYTLYIERKVFFIFVKVTPANIIVI